MEQEKSKFQEKGKRGLLKIIFGRTGIIIGLLAIQVLFLLMGIYKLASVFPYLWAGSVLLAVGVVMSLIGNDDNPAFKLTWMLLMLVMPIFGILLYIYVKTDLGHRTMIKAFDEVIRETKPLTDTDNEVQPEDVPGELKGIASYLKNEGFPTFRDTQTQYFPLGEPGLRANAAGVKKGGALYFPGIFHHCR